MASVRADPGLRGFVFSGLINSYDRGVWIDCGINIILAVSLNLILGHTGQFSLGHAGFMSVGGYTAAKISLVFSPGVPEPMRPLLLLAALLSGGLLAAAAGLVVGVPSLRLKEITSPSSRWALRKSSACFCKTPKPSAVPAD